MRRHPRLALAAGLGLLALVAAGVTIAALSTHPGGGGGPTPAMAQFERAVAAVFAERVNLETSIRDAKGRPGSTIGVRPNGSLSLPNIRLSVSNRAFDRNQDGRLTIADIGEFLADLIKDTPDADGEISYVTFLKVGGLADTFHALDANGDRVLNQKDIELLTQEEYQELAGMLPKLAQTPDEKPQEPQPEPDPEPTPEDDQDPNAEDPDLPPREVVTIGDLTWRGYPIIDVRSGERLIVDPIRLSWLREIEAQDDAGHWPLRGRAIPREELGFGQLVTVHLKDGESFVAFQGKMVPQNFEVTFVKDSGEIATLYYSRHPEATVTHSSPIDDLEHPLRVWYRWYSLLMPPKKTATDSESWAKAARELYAAGGMAEEAANAAKRALIYDPSLSDLYPMVGVERRGWQLVRASSGD